MISFRPLRISLLSSVGALALFGTVSLAHGQTVSQIDVVGAQRVEADTVRTYLTLKQGDAYSASEVNSSLKKLFATGLFADVAITREGERLVVAVVENPVINRIAFEGNRSLDDQVLDSEVTLRPRVIYTRTRVQQDVERILTLYRRSGRFGATVEPKVIQLEQNRVDLAFEIKEGPKTGVSSINFVGNRAYGDSTLAEIIRTRESSWYNFLTSEDNYDPDRVNFDKELLRRYYLSKGYADFKVTSAVAELTPERDSFHITYTVDEGPRYEVRSVNIENELPDLDVASLSEYLSLEAEDWYNADEVENISEDLVDAVSFQGFPFVDVSPSVDRNSEERKIDLTFNISQGERVFVERININGNFRTLDKVVRREFRLVEGDALNVSKLKRSEKRINDLNFFEKVELTQSPGSAPDQTVIDVTVEEKSTGALSLGAGYSSADGPIGQVSITEANLLGRGQRLKLSTDISGGGSRFDIAFTEPYFLDRELAAGFDLYNTEEEKDDDDSQSYDLQRTGVVLRVNYPITDELSQGWNYQLDQTTIENIDTDASRLIRSQEGEEITSAIGHGITYDRRDSITSPTEGYVLRLNNTVAGLGGTVAYLQNQISGTYYYPVSDQWIFSTKARFGHILGLGEDVRLQNRYFLGGDNLRGFESSGIGPRDNATDDSLGGEYVMNGSTALSFPLGLPNEFQIKGLLFSDYGILTELEPSDSSTIDEQAFRASVGFGFNWVSPVGPISLDWAFPILKEDHDKEENFRFSFGTNF